MYCPKCKEEKSGNNLFCVDCGTRLGKRCEKCGTVSPADSNFCEECGSKFEGTENYLPKQAEPERKAKPEFQSEPEPVIPERKAPKNSANGEKKPFRKEIVVPVVVIGCLAVAVAMKFGTGFFSKENEETDPVQDMVAASETQTEAPEEETVVPEEKVPEETLEETTEEALANAAEKPVEEFTKLENIDDLDAETEVLNIRAMFNNIQSNVKNYSSHAMKDGLGTVYESKDGRFTKYVIPNGTRGIPYTREYYCVGGDLFFAFYYRGKTEERFYFYEGDMFRWIDENKNTYDLQPENPKWQEWFGIIESETDLFLE